MKALSVNAIVKVKLTPTGKAVFQQSCYGMQIKPELKEDQAGYSEWQLWNLMEVFGSNTHIGIGGCFETVILIDEKDLQEWDGK